MTSRHAENSEQRLRTAELLRAFSLATDLADGLHMDHGARSCYIGLSIARLMGLPVQQQVDIYYSDLLKAAGCTCWTTQLADFWARDEIIPRRESLYLGRTDSPIGQVGWMLEHVGSRLPLPVRARRMLDLMTHGQEFMREGFQSGCEVASRIAGRLGLSEGMQNTLLHVAEAWNGTGMPDGLRGEDIPLTSRVVFATPLLEVSHKTGGREAAIRRAMNSKGHKIDPQVADAFLALAEDSDFWEGLEQEDTWELLLEMEPESQYRYLRHDQAEDVALACADFADLKSPYLASHSRRVADAAEGMAREMGLAEPDVECIRCAALLHDLGIVTVPSFVLNRPESDLTAAEREQIRLHPYYTHRIVSTVPAMRPMAALAAAHHERLDGQGYHQGLTGSQITPGARILAVADQFDNLTHDAPDRPALSTKDALEAMQRTVDNALCPESFQALRRVVGEEPSPAHARRREWPAGLTDREVDVIRLVGKGMTRKQIAGALVVTEHTVRHHLEHIYGKIDVSTRVAATLFAMEHGLLE